jgi:hypothetical protein
MKQLFFCLSGIRSSKIQFETNAREAEKRDNKFSMQLLKCGRTQGQAFRSASFFCHRIDRRDDQSCLPERPAHTIDDTQDGGKYNPLIVAKDPLIVAERPSTNIQMGMEK